MIKKIRLEKGYTQREIAGIVGCCIKSYILYENHPKTLSKIKCAGIMAILEKLPCKV